MTEPLGGQQLLGITSVSCSALSRDRVAVRVNGRWAGRHRIPLGRALLVVEAEGRRHRFPMIPEARAARREQTVWSASFAVPAWLEPYVMRGARLQLGVQSIELPTPSVGGPSADPELAAGTDASAQPAGSQGQLAARVRQLERSLTGARREPARLNAMLAKVRADLNARTSQYQRLQAAYSDLRDELDRQRSLNDRERARRVDVESTVNSLMDTVAALRVELAEVAVSREAALEEVGALREELGRLGAAVSAARAEVGSEALALGEAESLLAEARSVSARITRRFRSSVSAGGDA